MAVRRDLSTFAVAELLGVDPGSVANWIDNGTLGAYRTPGGHRRVVVSDLIAFLRDHGMPVPPELLAGPVRVVVVDDEQDMTQVIARAVRRAHPDFELTEANDGFQAGAVVATLKPDVVILDLRMPGIDGFEVCRLIKSQPATRHVKVIAITAYPSEENERKILDCGAQKCLTKPLDLDELVGEVEAALGMKT